MKVEIVHTFYGRPDDADDQLTMYIEGAMADVPDDFAKMVVEKGLAKLASAKPAKKEPANEVE